MLDRFTSAYIQHPLGELGLGTTKIDEADRFDEDSASIADLVAGASAELLSNMLTSFNEIPKQQRQFVPDQISRKSDLINHWFSSQDGCLRKCGVVMSMAALKHYRVGTWTLDDAVIQLQ